jgi:hypothetical protein
LEILYWPSGIAHNDGVRFDILHDHSPHTDHGSFADPESLADARSSADLYTGTNLDIPRHSNERSKGHEVTDAHIMPNGAVEISDEVHADGGHHRHSDTSNHHRSGRDVNGWVAWSFNIDCGESGMKLLQASYEYPPSSGGTHSDDAIHLGAALINGSQDWPALRGGGARYSIVEKAQNRKRRDASLRCEGNLAPKSACPDNDHGIRGHAQESSALASQ